MLFKDAFIISPATFSLIQQLQELPMLQEFYLVGGTALALQLGHRNSIDIDLFTQNEFENEALLSILNESYSVQLVFDRKNTIISLINNIKTDFICHKYPFIKPPISDDGIQMLSKEDINAMKLHAIVQSGKRLKDFIDIYFLLEYFPVAEMIEFYVTKYSHSNPMIALKALNYFDEIDEDIDPPKLRTPISLEAIMLRINTAIQHPYKTF